MSKYMSYLVPHKLFWLSMLILRDLREVLKLFVKHEKYADLLFVYILNLSAIELIFFQPIRAQLDNQSTNHRLRRRHFDRL